MHIKYCEKEHISTIANELQFMWNDNPLILIFLTYENGLFLTKNHLDIQTEMLQTIVL